MMLFTGEMQQKKVEVAKMKKKRRNRLREQRGESISEVLIAVLISAIALTMLATMISATTRLVLRSKSQTEEYVEKNNQLVEKGDSDRSGEVIVELVRSGSTQKIRLTDDTNYGLDDENAVIPVQYYVNKNIGKVSVTSYKIKGGTS